MALSGNRDPGIDRGEYYPETRELIERVRAEPTYDFRCSHGDGDCAIGIYEVPRGCVALPGLETQTLCAQHVISNGSFEGMHLVVDLSVNGGWSRHSSEQPDFYIVRDLDTREHTLIEFAGRPFEIKTR